MGVTKHRHRLSREVLELPPLEIPQTHLDTVLGNQLWVALSEQGLDQTIPTPSSFPGCCNQQV